MFAKSQKGLWVKAVEDKIENVIRVYWQTRHVLKNKNVYEIGSNGTPNGMLSAQSSMMERSWVECGVIQLDQPCLMQFAKQPAVFIELKQGIMRHVVDLIALGWGETPEEVISWFSDLKSLDWFQDQQRYVAQRGKYAEFDSIEVVSRYKDEVVVAVYVGSQRFEFESEKCWAEILSAWVPIDE